MKIRTIKEEAKMIINKKINPIVEYYVYKVSDLGTKAEMLESLLDNENYTAIQKFIEDNFGLSLDLSYCKEVAKALQGFILEAYHRIIYFDEEDIETFHPVDNLAEGLQTLVYLGAPYIIESASRYEEYCKQLESQKSKLFDNLKTIARNKVANADTPVSKKFDENFTIDDYISFLNVNYSESENEYLPLIEKLASVRDNLSQVSKEIKELLECELIVYNSGMESEVI